jgi:hypothetical protein
MDEIKTHWGKISSTTLLGKVSKAQCLSVADRLLLVVVGANPAFLPKGSKEKTSMKWLLLFP